MGGAGEAREALEAALFEMKRVIVGQEAMLERLLVALLGGGHVLLEGVPGLAKTLSVRTLADVLGGSFRRVQFTPDLVPSDLVGTRIYRPDTGAFDTELGPVFCNFLLADEINRAPAKVQSGLLGGALQGSRQRGGGRGYPTGGGPGRHPRRPAPEQRPRSQRPPGRDRAPGGRWGDALHHILDLRAGHGRKRAAGGGPVACPARSPRTERSSERRLRRPAHLAVAGLASSRTALRDPMPRALPRASGVAAKWAKYLLPALETEVRPVI